MAISKLWLVFGQCWQRVLRPQGQRPHTAMLLGCPILGESFFKATHRKWTEVVSCLSCPLGINLSLWSGSQKQWCSLSQAGDVSFFPREHKTMISHITVSYQDWRSELSLGSPPGSTSQPRLFFFFLAKAVLIDWLIGNYLGKLIQWQLRKQVQIELNNICMKSESIIVVKETVIDIRKDPIRWLGNYNSLNHDWGHNRSHRFRV